MLFFDDTRLNGERLCREPTPAKVRVGMLRSLCYNRWIASLGVIAMDTSGVAGKLAGAWQAIG